MTNLIYYLKEQANIRIKIPDKYLNNRIRRFFYLLAFTVLFLLIPGINNVKAQKLYVLDENNVQNEFVLENISKLTFPAGNLLVSNIDGSAKSINISTIRNLSFNDFATHNETPEIPAFNAIRIFPNPAWNVLNVLFKTQEPGSCCFSIYDQYGRVLINKEISCQRENNTIAINVDELSPGMYFLRMQQKQKTETTKFLKN